jgi:hypothetical protein
MAGMTIMECVQAWLEENGGAAACYLGPPSPSGARILYVTRPLGPADERLADAVADLEDELDWAGHHVRAFVLDVEDEASMAEALSTPGCVPIFRRPPGMAA